MQEWVEPDKDKIELTIDLDYTNEFANHETLTANYPLGGHITREIMYTPGERRTEIDYLTGYVSKIGKRNRVPTPFCNKITKIVNNLGVGFDPSPDHLKDLERMLP